MLLKRDKYTSFWVDEIEWSEGVVGKVQGLGKMHASALHASDLVHLLLLWSVEFPTTQTFPAFRSHQGCTLQVTKGVPFRQLAKYEAMQSPQFYEFDLRKT